MTIQNKQRNADKLIRKHDYRMKHMKTIPLFFGFVIFTVSLFGQSTPQKYPDLVRIADSLYNAKDFKNSAFTFSKAFKANGWNATPKEH
jgi:hypothetical protein